MEVNQARWAKDLKYARKGFPSDGILRVQTHLLNVITVAITTVVLRTPQQRTRVWERSNASFGDWTHVSANDRFHHQMFSSKKQLVLI